MASSLTPDPIAITRTLAAELGLRVDPMTIADRSNLVLRLDPEPLVARVAMATSAVRVGIAWLRREVEVSRFLAEQQVRVTRPASALDPGPHERAGFVVSFWDLETITNERADPSAAGQALAAAHRALADYPRAKLPSWGAFEEARAVFARVRTSHFFERDELLRLERAWEIAERTVVEAATRSASFQAVHGDAHIGNVLATDRGAVWTDWEDAFVGPIEFDLACLRSKAELFDEERPAIEAMSAAYDAPFDAGLVKDLGLVRNVQVIVWLAVFAERQPELLPRMHARVARLP